MPRTWDRLRNSRCVAEREVIRANDERTAAKRDAEQAPPAGATVERKSQTRVYKTR